jgi:hypothetical protein
MGKRFSRKKLDRIQAARLGDYRHMLRCINGGRLPGYEDRRGYLEQILAMPGKLPPRDEVKQQLRLRNDDRTLHRLHNIAPIDKTKAQLAKLRKQKHKERMRLARRHAGIMPRAAYRAAVASKKPWIKEGKSRRTYYRHRAKARAMAQGACQPHEPQMAQGP